MRDFYHFAGDGHVVLIAGGGFGIGFKGAIHHHTSKAVANGGVAGGRLVTMVLVHDNGDVGVGFHRSQNQVTQEVFPSIFTGTPRCLQNHGTVGFMGRLHDGLDLLHVVDVEGGNAVTIFGCVIEQQAHGYECHRVMSSLVERMYRFVNLTDNLRLCLLVYVTGERSLAY